MTRNTDHYKKLKAKNKERREKVARAKWSGMIKFGLMSIPCKEYSAVSEGTTRLSNIHRDCKTKLRQPKYCETCGRFVEGTEIVKGYPINDHEFVLLEDDELSAIKLESNGQIEITEFVEPQEIDQRYLEEPSFLAPNWESSKKRFLGLNLFSLFEEALKVSGLWALGRVVKRNRETLVLIRPFKKGILLLQTLRYPEELKDDTEIKSGYKDVDDRELAVAVELILKMRGKFDLSKYRDRYEEGLKELVEAKLKGEKVVEVVKAEVKEEEDIYSQLLKSLELVKR